MNIAGINLNDFCNGDGVTISIFVQYCPHHCKGCFNPETWPREGGKYWDNQELIKYICSKINDNGIHRDISLLGGEPLCPENMHDELELIKGIKEYDPNGKIYIWTGYTMNQLKNFADSNDQKCINEILNLVDCIIDGPYVEALKDITLKMRGSSNQNINYLR